MRKYLAILLSVLLLLLTCACSTEQPEQDNQPAKTEVENTVEKKEEKRIDFIEFHEHTCEGILPLDGDVILFVGTPGIYGLTPEHIEAFYVPRGTFVKMNPLIVHGNQFSTSENTVHSMCLLAGRTFHNDMHVKQLSEEEKILIK